MPHFLVWIQTHKNISHSRSLAYSLACPRFKAHGCECAHGDVVCCLHGSFQSTVGAHAMPIRHTTLSATVLADSARTCCTRVSFSVNAALSVRRLASQERSSS